MKQVRNVTVDYFYRFFSSFDLVGSIWILFLGYREMSLFEIGILEGIFHLTSIIFEVPTGAIADLFGRKRTLIIGRLAGALSAILMLVGGHFIVYLVAMVTASASYNFNSGSEEALVYDSLLETGQEEKYLKINGKLYFLMQSGAAVGALLGGYISEYSFELVYGLNVLARLFACVVALFYKEVESKNKGEELEKVTVKSHFSLALKVLKENPRVGRLSAFYAGISTVVCTIMFYSQEYFATLGMRNFYIATLGFIGGFVAAFGALLANKVHVRMKSKAIRVLCVFVGIACMGMVVPIYPAAVIGFLCLLYCDAIVECIVSNQLNAMIPSAQRATLLSVQSMLFSIGMIVIFPLCGLLMTYIKMGYVFAGLGVVTVFITLLSRNLITEK